MYSRRLTLEFSTCLQSASTDLFPWLPLTIRQSGRGEDFQLAILPPQTEIMSFKKEEGRMFSSLIFKFFSLSHLPLNEDRFNLFLYYFLSPAAPNNMHSTNASWLTGWWLIKLLSILHVNILGIVAVSDIHTHRIIREQPNWHKGRLSPFAFCFLLIHNANVLVELDLVPSIFLSNYLVKCGQRGRKI